MWGFWVFVRVRVEQESRVGAAAAVMAARQQTRIPMIGGREATARSPAQTASAFYFLLFRPSAPGKSLETFLLGMVKEGSVPGYKGAWVGLLTKAVRSAVDWGPSAVGTGSMAAAAGGGAMRCGGGSFKHFWWHDLSSRLYAQLD